MLPASGDFVILHSSKFQKQGFNLMAQQPLHFLELASFNRWESLGFSLQSSYHASSW